MGSVTAGSIRIVLPDPRTFDWRAGLVTLIAAALLLGWHRSVPLTLAICSGLGAGLLYPV